MGASETRQAEADDPKGSGDARMLAGGLVLVGIISVQFGSALATTLFDDLGPGGAVLLRTAFAAAVLAAIWRPARELLRGQALRDILVFGFVLAGMNLCFFAALERLPLGIAVTLEFTGPLGVAIAGSRRRTDYLFAALAVAGILLLTPSIGDGLDTLGVFLALLAGAFWAAYMFASARVGRGPVGRAGLTPAMAFSTLLLLPLGIADGGAELLDPHLLAVGLAVAMLSSAIPYVAELEALRRLPPKTVGVLLALEPAAAAMIGLFALDQALPAREVAAIALIVVASVGALRTAEPIEPEA
jgi:inner membrane transporter RhtA